MMWGPGAEGEEPRLELFHLTVLGSPGCGKTALISAFVNNFCPTVHVPTPDNALYYKTLDLVEVRSPEGHRLVEETVKELEDPNERCIVCDEELQTLLGNTGSQGGVVMRCAEPAKPLSILPPVSGNAAKRAALGQGTSTVSLGAASAGAASAKRGEEASTVMPSGRMCMDCWFEERTRQAFPVLVEVEEGKLDEGSYKTVLHHGMPPRTPSKQQNGAMGRREGSDDRLLGLGRMMESTVGWSTKAEAKEEDGHFSTYNPVKEKSMKSVARIRMGFLLVFDSADPDSYDAAEKVHRELRPDPQGGGMPAVFFVANKMDVEPLEKEPLRKQVRQKARAYINGFDHRQKLPILSYDEVAAPELKKAKNLFRKILMQIRQRPEMWQDDDDAQQGDWSMGGVLPNLDLDMGMFGSRQQPAGRGASQGRGQGASAGGKGAGRGNKPCAVQ